MKQEYWPPAVLARSVEQLFLRNKSECRFDTTKNKQMLLLPGMGAPVSQLFELVNALRSDQSFQAYGVTALELGLSLGDFSLTLQKLIQKIESKLLDKTTVEELILYAHSHGGRFASELSTYLQKQHPGIHIILITGGTPILERPKSFHNWLLSLAFRNWPHINQPQLDMFFALYSDGDEVVDMQHATNASQAKLIVLDEFSHTDFIDSDKIIPVLKKLIYKDL
ncbi:MAG: hypothetical protein WC693_06735 [Patescibacteria group bacterium]|jgi:triacylglycerol esterase/lipase EstA (alpha/beta hydrolase family)